MLQSDLFQNLNENNGNEKFLYPREVNLDQLFKGQYDIPVYQRPYSWKEEHVKQLLDDIDESYRNSLTDDIKHDPDDAVLFAGTIFIKPSDSNREVHTVIDGQQRITTLTLLFMALLNRFYTDFPEDKKVVPEIKKLLWKQIKGECFKERRVLTLGNVDRSALEDLMNELFSRNDLMQYIENKKSGPISAIEKNLLKNYVCIHRHITKLKRQDEIISFLDFIKHNIRFISIEINTKTEKLFRIFESLNSKGKRLEEIDLIKSYIFQNLDSDDYDEYLKKWGELITKTEDRLGDYLSVFIRGYVTYPINEIKLKRFKNLAERDLKRYYGKESLPETLKELIKDMLWKVKYYMMLSNFEELSKSRISQKATVFLMMNKLAGYIHTEPLLFRLLAANGRKNNEETVRTLETILEYAFRFMLTYQTIGQRESKDTKRVFARAQRIFYRLSPSKASDIDLSCINADDLVSIFCEEVQKSLKNNNALTLNIKQTITLDSKNVAKLILVYLLVLKNDGNVNYLKVHTLLKPEAGVRVKYILPLSPGQDNQDYKYFHDSEGIKFRKGHDFPIDKDITVMSEKEFKSACLNTLGNLKLVWNDKDTEYADIVELESFDRSFNSYSHIKSRELQLTQKIIESNLVIRPDEYTQSPREQVTVNHRTYETLEYKKFNPISYTLMGDKFNLSKPDKRELLKSLCKTLYGMAPDEFKAFAKQGFQLTEKSKRYCILDTPEGLREPTSLGQSVYVELNLNTEYLMKFCYKLIEQLKLPPETLTVDFEKK